jgi:low temperature requirement protein LtrA
MLWWSVAIACEYVSPMFGFALPGLGRSRTSDWTIEGVHLAERCQLFVIVALGETLLASGASLADVGAWSAPVLLALLATFLGILGLWWLYFGTSSHDATVAITRSADPGRMGAYFHYIHAILVMGVIVTAVGNGLVMASPVVAPSFAQLVAIVAGPTIYLLGSAIHKRVVYGAAPLSHVVGAGILLAAVVATHTLPLLVQGWTVAIVVLAVGLWEFRACRGRLAGQA